MTRNPIDLLVYTNPLPMPNFHVAVLRKRSEIRQYVGKRVIASGLQLLFALPKRKKAGSVVAQVHFGRQQYTPSQAKAWLKKHNMKLVEFYKASVKNPCKTRANPTFRAGDRIPVDAMLTMPGLDPEIKRQLRKALSMAKGPFHSSDLELVVTKVPKGTSKVLVGFGKVDPANSRIAYTTVPGSELHGNVMVHEWGDTGIGDANGKKRGHAPMIAWDAERKTIVFPETPGNRAPRWDKKRGIVG